MSNEDLNKFEDQFVKLDRIKAFTPCVFMEVKEAIFKKRRELNAM